MRAMGVTGPKTTEEGRAPRVDVWRGLLWRDWIAHGGLMMAALAVWLMCGWVLLIFFHPGWIIGFGVVYAVRVAQALGGGEAAEGSEEFSFALPPTRGERYLARLILGGGSVFVFTVGGTLAIALDLPQALWSIFVNSGFTEPFPACEPRFLYTLAVACPLAVFAFTFATASNAGSRGLAGWSWLPGILLAGGVLLGGFLCERPLWQELNGFVACPALLALGAAALLVGYQAYVRKEGISRPAPMASGGARWVWVVVIVLAVLMLLSFVMAVRLRGHQVQVSEEAARQEVERQMAVEQPRSGPLAEPETESIPAEDTLAPQEGR